MIDIFKDSHENVCVLPPTLPKNQEEHHSEWHKAHEAKKKAKWQRRWEIAYNIILFPVWIVPMALIGCVLFVVWIDSKLDPDKNRRIWRKHRDS